MKMMIFLSIFPSTFFILSSHPVSMMLTIILQTFILCMVLWMLINTSWFSYIMFLIFLGGIMVLFIYIASLASNEKFNLDLNQTMKQSMILLTLMMIFMYNLNSQITKFNKQEFTEMIFKIYSFTLMNLTMFAIFYLIFTLIVVVKMMSLKEGPLRSK